MELKKDCEHYPCHKDLEDCTYCYCPIYPCKDIHLGHWFIKGDSKVWDCSYCTLFHRKNVVENLEKHLTKEEE